MTDTALKPKSVFRLWLPLAVMWIIMGIEQPAVAAVISRLPEATIQLAAFGVAFSLGLIVESPIVQLLAAGTALADGRPNFRRLMKVMHILAAVLTAIHIVLALPAVARFVVGRLMGAPEELIAPAQRAMAAMIPWSASIGYRRLWQGVLIRYGRSELVSISMVFRLFATGAVLVVGFLLGAPFGGAALGGLALSFGVVAGAAAAGILLIPIVRREMPASPPRDSDLTLATFSRFYTPLALTSIITLLARPLLTFGIGRAAFALESLAVWPVLTAFVFLFHSITFALQEVTIAEMARGIEHSALRRFAVRLSLAIGIAFFLVALSPLSDAWYRLATGLPEELLPFTNTPTLIVAAFPAIAVFVFLARGRLVHERKTRAITLGVAVNVTTLLLVMAIGAAVFDWPGVTIAAVAYVTALSAEALFLTANTRDRTDAAG